ncbi:integrin alpha [Nitrosomonas ureae]|uniref:FG-GAP repeat-containing protein n=1 Tax=Nitrosomonas ureae TaxID=44577 RepID=A0A1H5UT41_9PROT|nr:integrin alpha [Nitrosomonas ureae]SEF78219.1 FG-GAP repeat-containing protein [Nitrosomonas ureae]
MATTIINLSSLDGNNGFRMDGVIDHGILGRSVSDAGDINGDGFDDVIIGASGANTNYVVFGKASGFAATLDVSSLDGSNGFRLDGPAGDFSGLSVSKAGDVNGDNFDDVIVGTYGANASYVVFGKAAGFGAAFDLSGLDGSNGFLLDGTATGGTVGRQVSDAGDINGDGFDDVMVSAIGFSSYPETGSSYVVFGKSAGFDATLDLSSLDGNNGFHLDGAAAYGVFSISVSSAGDVNGDDFDDVIVGAPEAGYVVFGKASGFDATLDFSSLDGSNGFRLGETTDALLTRSVSSAGDVNGDGFDDVIIGAYGSTNGFSSGASFVVFGKATGFDATLGLSSLDGSNGFRMDGVAAFDFLGDSVSSAGDVNGDGFDDLLVGASGADPNGESSGSSYVVFGKASGFDATLDLSSLDSSSGLRLDGVAAFDLLGESVSSAGDVNGDGFDDLLVGAPFAEDGFGSSYVVFGRSSFVDEVDFQGTPGDDNFTGTKAAERFTGEAGDDRMIGRGGADSFDGGAGNDYIRILGDDFQLVDGGAGTDILGLAGSGFNLDLSSVIDKIHGIETIGLYGVGDNSLTLTAQDVLDLSDTTNTLKVKGNAGDSVMGLSSGWEDGGIRGNFHEYTQGDAVLLIKVGVATDFVLGGAG